MNWVLLLKSFRSLFFNPLRGAYLNIIFENMPVGFSAYDLKKNKFIWANPYFLDKVGLTNDDLINSGNNWTNFVHKEDLYKTTKTASSNWQNGFLPLFKNRWINQKTGQDIAMYWTVINYGGIAIGMSRYENELIDG